MDARAGFFGLIIVALGFVTALLLLPLIQYILAAALLAFLLAPVHERLVPHIGNRSSAFLLTVFAVVATLIPLLVISVIILQTAVEFTQDFDPEDASETVSEILEAYFGIEAATGFDLETWAEGLTDEYASPLAEQLLAEVTGLIGLTIRVALGLMILVFLLYYFLKDGDELLAWIRQVSPLEEEVLAEFFDETHVITWAMLKSHVFVAIVEGILGGIGLYLLGVPNPMFWTVIMVIVSILPIIGVWLVWGPAVVWLYVAGSPMEGTILLLYGITVLAVVDNYLRAILVEVDSGLHPAVVLVGVIGGIYLLGFMGLFLGPILLALFKASANVFSRTYGFNSAVSDAEQ